MAEDGAPQNQGQQQQSDPLKEAGTEAVDAKKAERAAKERERRRRRRRKKAELKRLERETLQQQPGAVPPTTPKVDKVESPKPKLSENSPTLDTQPNIQPAKPRIRKPKPEKIPGDIQKAPEKKVETEPKISQEVQDAPYLEEDRPAIQRSEENTARSQNIVPQAEPEHDFLESDSKQKSEPESQPKTEPVQQPEIQNEEEHPFTHQTHSFAGPLIQPKSEPVQEPQPQQQPEPVQTEPTPEPIEPEPKPEVQPEPEPELIYNHEPQPESDVQSEPVSEPEPIRSEPIQPEPVKPEPVQPEPIIPEPEVQLPSQQNEDIVIHDEHPKAPQTHVDMNEVHEEEKNFSVNDLPPIFPVEEHDEEPVEEKTDEQQVEEQEAAAHHEQEESDHQDNENALKHQEEEAEEVEPIKPEKKSEEVEKHENNEATKENLSESEGLNVRKSFLQSAGAFSAGVLKSIGTALHNFRLKFDFRKLWIFVILVVIGGGLYAGYIFKVHEQIYNYVAGFFKAPPPVEVNIDNELLNEWGINTAIVFGDNRGSTRDLFANQLYDAYYFGFLGEPQVQGETGITPAYYYGTLADITADANDFMRYINDLRALVSAYDVDVYKMLDQTTDREKGLNDYQAQMDTLMATATQNVKEINADIDDLKVSYDSLNADKSQSETDFFTALQGLAAQKSNFLLQSFIDVTQKQEALKARESALVSLLNYYSSAIKNLQIRIVSIKQNHAVLVQGIHVINIPGANLNIILPDNQS